MCCNDLGQFWIHNAVFAQANTIRLMCSRLNHIPSTSTRANFCRGFDDVNARRRFDMDDAVTV